jgi:uncharacterized protein YndB with AHSA1/START domain
MTPPDLHWTLDRSIVIETPRELVFAYFTDSRRWASWWGNGSSIEARPGGPVTIVNPGGVTISGDVISVDPPSAIVFTYGFAGGTPIPAGSSLVTVRLDEDPAGTRLHLSHAFADESARDRHVQGWRYQLSRLGNVVADAHHANAEAIVDRWFAAWSEPDDGTRDAMLPDTVSATVRLRDRFSLIDGIDDLRPHLAAVHRFMPGTRLIRQGTIRHCQGMVLADWIAQSADGQPRGRGTNVFVLDRDGLIAAVTGFWAPSP